MWPLLTEPNLGLNTYRYIFTGFDACFGMHYFVSLILRLEDRNTLQNTLSQVIFTFSVVVVFIYPLSSEGFSYTY